MKRHHASRAWAAWALAGCALEVVALRWGEDGSTLSAHVWDTGRVPRRTAAYPRLSKGLTTGFLAWVVMHFLSGGRI